MARRRPVGYEGEVHASMIYTDYSTYRYIFPFVNMMHGLSTSSAGARRSNFEQAAGQFWSSRGRLRFWMVSEKEAWWLWCLLLQRCWWQSY